MQIHLIDEELLEFLLDVANKTMSGYGRIHVYGDAAESIPLIVQRAQRRQFIEIEEVADWICGHGYWISLTDAGRRAIGLPPRWISIKRFWQRLYRANSA